MLEFQVHNPGCHSLLSRYMASPQRVIVGPSVAIKRKRHYIFRGVTVLSNMSKSQCPVTPSHAVVKAVACQRFHLQAREWGGVGGDSYASASMGNLPHRP
jgi:hypothetical protein